MSMSARALKLSLLAANVIAALAVIAVAVELLLVPAIAKYWYGERYKELVFQCDDVMRGHFIAKSQVSVAPSEEAIKNLSAAEVSLLACHDYDKLRKKLLTLGLSEADLASLGLEAMEKNSKDVTEFVKTHEIHY
jgi:hypothetical protein